MATSKRIERALSRQKTYEKHKAENQLKARERYRRRRVGKRKLSKADKEQLYNDLQRYGADPSPNTLQLSDAELDAESDARTLAEAFSLELQSMEDTLTDWKRGMRERDWMEQKSRNNPRKFAEFGDEMVFQNWCLCRTKMSVLHQNVRLMMDRIGNECNAYSSWIQLYKRAARLERTFERTDSILGEELLLWEAGEGVWQSMYEDGSLIWQN